MTKSNLFIRTIIISFGLFVGFVLATQITNINIWNTSAQNGDVITSTAWNELVSKASPCASQGVAGCYLGGDSQDINAWSCKYSRDTTSKKCIGPSGVCGSDNGVPLNNSPTNLCTAGTASSVTDNGVGNTYTWSCQGSRGGTTSSCSANHSAVKYCSQASGTCTNGQTDATSCKYIQSNGLGSADGSYWIDPDGSAGSTYSPFKAYCDMTNDGGGWTLVMAGYYTNYAGWNTTSDLNTNNFAGADTFKFSDAKINAIKSLAYRIDNNKYSKKYFVKSTCVYNHTAAAASDCAKGYTDLAFTSKISSSPSSAGYLGISFWNNDVINNIITNSGGDWWLGNDSTAYCSNNPSYTPTGCNFKMWVK